MIENEDADPVGAQTDPIQIYTDLAAKHGLIRAGERLDQNMIDMMVELVGICATLGDPYGDETSGANAGEHIRSELWPR